MLTTSFKLVSYIRPIIFIVIISISLKDLLENVSLLAYKLALCPWVARVDYWWTFGTTLRQEGKCSPNRNFTSTSNSHCICKSGSHKPNGSISNSIREETI